MEMQYSKSGLALTEQFEGCKLEAYQDQGGVWTLGYGRTFGVQPGMTCTLEQAQQWLESDMDFAAKCVNTLVLVPLTQGEFDGVTVLAYNIGCKAFATSTLLLLLNKGDFTGAANEFEKWDHVKGKVSAGLLRRRQAEKAEFCGTN